MAARIVTPKRGDEITLPAGGMLEVIIKHGADPGGEPIDCNFNGVADPLHPTDVFGDSILTSLIPVAASATADVVVNLSGAENARERGVIVTVATGYAVTKKTNNPAWEPSLPPTGVPAYFVISGTSPANVLYVAVVVYQVPLAGPEVVVDGVLGRINPGGTWAVGVNTPNFAGMSYYARVLEFAAGDVVWRKRSVFLH